MKWAADSNGSAVSILTCTKRADCINTLFDNYRRQNFNPKELIVIINNNDLKINDYITAAKKHKNVRVYKIPEHRSLGFCLNFGVQLAKYSYIAKFDDDDYYATNYLTDSMQTLHKSKADIVGKRAHFMYLNDKKLLLVRYSHMENKYVTNLQGATLLIKRNVFQQISFPDRNRGECVKFCSDCAAHGFKIYAGNKYNFAAIRRKNSKDHTWIVSDKKLLSKSVKVIKVKNFKKYVTRS
ncbi:MULTISPECIES: glycosyltransferase family 2 protein [unclassified Paenibacillus]|uniref:glycosyltransferase family 2 protein n=1 Tax=unclassified Paenibacillus TaxID=185978 RepID=UPI0004F63DBB|nr:glycosyltransferase family A protein [Paenibacillus sp. FSL R5-0345]AIQ36413.1 glycosyl transferase family 2 [Paenibacillus sp. FSL R5-0345]